MEIGLAEGWSYKLSPSPCGRGKGRGLQVTRHSFTEEETDKIKAKTFDRTVLSRRGKYG